MNGTFRSAVRAHKRKLHGLQPKNNKLQRIKKRNYCNSAPTSSGCGVPPGREVIRKGHISPARSRIKKGHVYKDVGKQCSFNKSTRNSHKRNPKQRNSASCPPSIGKLENVSEALGLGRRMILNEVTTMSDDILYHRGLESLVTIIIESAYYDIEEQPLKEKLSEELLKQLGFTDFEVLSTIMARSGGMKQHLDVIDFIKRFIRDEFKYNPTLIGIFRATEEQDPKEVRRFSDYRNDEQNEHCEFVLLFHGTDLYSAIDIMKNGIELDFGRHKHDFSNGGGFYLTTIFEHAKTWARSQTRKPVVLELKIPKTCLEKARILNLDVSRRKGRSEWERVVSENRSGRPSKKLRQEMKEYDCIQGPISVPSQDDASMPFKPEPGSYQLCVIKRSFAKEIEENAKKAKFTLYTENKQ